MSMLGFIRILAAVSTLAGLAAHAWLSPDGSALRWATPAAAIAGVLGGRWLPRATARAAFGTAHVWPLAVFLATGSLDINAIIVWVALLTGLALAIAPVGRWSVPPTWALPIAAWAAILALGWPLVVWRELDFTTATLGANVSSNGVWAAPPRISAMFVLLSVVPQATALLLFDALWARYGRGSWPAFARDIVWPMTAGTAAAIGVGLWQGFVDLRWINPGVWPGLGRAGGPMFDANAFGAIAALWGSLAAGTLILIGRRGSVAAGVVLLFTSGAAVWVSGSRTALAGWFVSVLSLAVALVRLSHIGRRAVVIGLVVLAVLAAGAVRAGGSGTAIHRLWQTLPVATGDSLSTFAVDMWERNGYGVAAVAMLREVPLTGVGPGAFPLFAPDYAKLARDLTIPPDNAQNWWRHQIAELGFLGALPAVLCSLLVAATAWSLLRSRSQPPQAMLLAGATAAVGFMGMVGPPTAHPIVLETAVVLFFWAGSLVWSSDAPAPASARGRGASMLLLVLPIVWAALTLRTAWLELRPPYRAEHIGWGYGYGFGAPEPVAGGERRWAGSHAVGVIPAAGRRLVLEIEAASESIASGPLHVRVRDRHRVVCESDRRTTDPFTCVVDAPPESDWLMVQIDASPADAAPTDRVMRVTSRWE